MAADVVGILGEHGGYSWRKRVSIAGVASLLIFGLSSAWIQLRKADTKLGTTSVSPFESIGQFLGELWRWLNGPHGRWCDRLIGAGYMLAGLFVLRVISMLIQVIKRQNSKENKGFLDYKFDAETAIRTLPNILESLTSIMVEVGSAMGKQTMELQRAASTAAQLRVSKRTAWDLAK